MTAIAIHPDSIKTVKRALTARLNGTKSSAITEALARALGFNTHASLLASVSTDPEIRLFDPQDFVVRLSDLSDMQPTVAAAEIARTVDSLHGEGVIRTSPLRSIRSVRLSRSKRSRAWQAVMIAGINETIRRKLISVRPGDNRWEEVDDVKGVGFHFEIEGHPAYCYVTDAGFDELSFKVRVWPVKDMAKWGRGACLNGSAAFHGSDLYASGWLERRDGAWLQVASDPMIFCRQNRLDIAAGFALERPLGYGAAGPFKM